MEWAAEQPTEITTTAIDLEFLPTDTNEDSLEFVLQQMHTALMALTSYEANDSGRIRRRHGGDCRSDMVRRQEEGNETFCARSFLLDGALFWNCKRGPNAGSPTCLSYEEEDEGHSWASEIKLAGLESLVPEDLAKTSNPQLESLANIRGCAPGRS